MSDYKKGKAIKAAKYKSMKVGQIYMFAGFAVESDGEERRLILKEPEPGKLINITTKRRDIEKDGKPTGKTETIGDIVVYEPIPNYRVWKGEKLKVYKTVIGCNMFRIFEATK